MKLLSLKIAGLLTVGVLMLGVIPTSGSFWYDSTLFEKQMVETTETYVYTVDSGSVIITSGLPTGVGGIFEFTHVAEGRITVIDSLGVLHESDLVQSGTFVGYTTDQPAEVLSISQLSFPTADIIGLRVGLDVVPVPEPTTLIAGALLLLPFWASAIRMLRKNKNKST